jgi:hypothetical protein
MHAFDVGAEQKRFGGICSSFSGKVTYTNRCLENANRDNKSTYNIDVFDETVLLPGRTLWLGDWMAPGHIVYDVYIVQLLMCQPIDRIIVQRNPCYRQDLCGVWDTFFKFFFAVTLRAANVNIPIYMRLEHSTPWTPHFMFHAPLTNGLLSSIDLNNTLCFQDLYWRWQKDTIAFHDSVSVEAARRFKAACRALLHDIRDARVSQPPAAVQGAGRHISVVIVTRGESTRAMRNHADLKHSLQKYLRNQLHSSHSQDHGRATVTLSVGVRHTGGRDMTTFRPHTSAAIAHTADVLVCTHGAFAAHTMYMPEGALLVELRGNYATSSNDDMFKHLADMFLVKHQNVTVANLTNHMQIEPYVISKREMGYINTVVWRHIKNKIRVNSK